MSTDLRQPIFAAARSIVVKVGTNLVTAKTGTPGPDMAFLQQVTAQVKALRDRGLHVTIVSSGAVGAGMAELSLGKRPSDVSDKQAVAAVGQRKLMDAWDDAFAPHGLKVAQLLLTRGDFDDRVRFLNIRNCILRLQQLGCVAIINENDTVAVEELGFGDNDMLAALVCNALRAEVLFLLTVVDGLLDAQGQRIDVVDDHAAAAHHVRGETSSGGTGGMRSKLDAASLVTGAGEVTVIANGREQDVLVRVLAGERIGTLFVPAKRKLDSRERWIGLTKRPAGTVTIDAGAVTALRDRGKSLLAKGVVHTAGDFTRGSVIAVHDPAGHEIARGLTNYDATDLARIMGHNSSEFESILGRPAFDEVIHRDNLVITG